MSISFACAECGKTFTVDDKFAGKKGKCKQCGAVMQIPEAGRPAAREAAPARRAAAPPQGDVYGFEDDPLPPRSMPVAYSGPAVEGGPRKKKPGGLFGSTSKKKKSSASVGGHSAASIVIRIVLGIFFSFAGMIGAALGIPGLQSVLRPGWATRSQVEAVYKEQITLTRELTGLMRGIVDVPSASSASSGTNQTIRKLTRSITTNKDRRAAQRDIDAARAKYQPEEQQAGAEFLQEVTRVAMIPGAVQALAIDAAMNELSAASPGGGAGTPGGFRPANFPRPQFTPPTFTPPPAPNFDPPNMPGMPGGPPGMPPGPRFGPRAGGPR